MTNQSISPDKPPPKKRGRKPKNLSNNPEENVVVEEKKIPTKRGRKPKGGKIVSSISIDKTTIQPEFNVILHLKCNSSDLAYKNKIVSNVDSYNNDKYKEIFLNVSSPNVDIDEVDVKQTSQNTNINICNKIKDLTKKLHFNNISNKKSACFWCTCDFNSPPIYLPKFYLNNKYTCYGCFCSPECATAYLFNEPIDTSVRFKRYHLLNYLYGKIYNYDTNFKPAPNPHYTLDKFYGNLSIEEYRHLLNNKKLLFIVDKPLTRVLPELHEDTEDFILNSNSIPSSNKFTLKKTNKQSKAQILNNNFNLK